MHITENSNSIPNTIIWSIDSSQLIGSGYALKYHVPSDYILILCGHPCHCVEIANFSRDYADAENKRKFHRTFQSGLMMLFNLVYKVRVTNTRTQSIDCDSLTCVQRAPVFRVH